MKLYEETKDYKLYHGNMLDMLDVIEKESIDSIITDPPYGLTSITKRFGKENSKPAKEGTDGSFQRLSKGFMGKEWDGSGIEYNIKAWEQCFEVLKEGGYLLAFGGTRTFHRIACAIEDAGFEIRDTIMWVYGSGFPKASDVGLMIDKENGTKSKVVGISTQGTGTNSKSGIYNANSKGKDSLKKVFEVKEATNEWGGWKNALKPAYEPIIVARKPMKRSLIENVEINRIGAFDIDECRTKEGRYPANLIHDGSEEAIKDFPSDTSRYFYCAKASTKDRDEGLDKFQEKTVGSICGGNRQKEILDDVSQRFRTVKKNIHPTVKPTELMQYLVRLVNPKGATILDCFMGSGSTGKAVMYENAERNKNYKFIGIELTEEYLPIEKARIEYARNKEAQTSFL